jgi:Short C-terminal domain
VGFRETMRQAAEQQANRFTTVQITDEGQVVNRRTKESVPLSGARATVETAGQLDKRVTATRLMLTGPLALGLRKKKDNRKLFLTIEGEGAGFVVEVHPNLERKARQFATRINAAASSPMASPPTQATPTDDPVEQIRKLGELREQGLLTPEEFETKKADLLGRL